MNFDPAQLHQYYSGLSDDELRSQHALGPQGFAAPQVWHIVDAAFQGRFGEGPTADQTEATGPAVEPQLAGIGGWLVLPAIGFVLTPIVGVVSLIAALGRFADVAAAGYGGLYVLELVVNLGLGAFLIYAATRFFGKRSNAPSTIIALLIANLVASALLLVIGLLAATEDFALESGKHLVGRIIGAALWIPYFRVSKRVKATFVN